MINIIPVEVTSLKVIQSELAVSVEKASRHFEAFVADRSAADQLAESQQCLSDVVGILKMLRLPGALQLAEDMVRLLDKTADSAASRVSARPRQSAIMA